MTEESVLRMTADINPAYSAEATKKAAAEAEAAATEKEATAAGKEAAAGTAHAVKEKGTANSVRLRTDAIPRRNVNNQTVTLQR